MSYALSGIGTSYSAWSVVDPLENNDQDNPNIWDIFNDLTSTRAIDGSAGIFESMTSFWATSVVPSAGGKVLEDALTSPEVPQALAEIRDSLSLSTVEIAKIFNVSRQAIYDWTAGKNVTASNRQRIAEIRAVSNSWKSRNLGRLGSLVREEVSGQSILAALCAEALDTTLVEGLLEQVAAKLEQSQTTRAVPSAQDLLERHGMSPMSGQAYRRNLKVSTPRR